MSNTNRTGNLSIDSDNIFPIIKKWLYSDHDIFIRELVSNGCDAITKLKKLEIMGEYTFPEDYKASIQVIVNPEEKTMKFIDTGLGMTADEVEEYITKIAFSGATAFLEKYKDKTNADEMIGHFGLGFYSAFMVADEVHIDTLSYRDGATAVHWECDGGTQYTIGDGSKTTVGTEITLYLNEESVEFANECIKEGMYIALGGVVTFKNAVKMKEVAINIPLDRLLLETDAPYLTPVPFRGKENQPAYTKYVAEEIAKLRNTTVDEINKATTQNTFEVFGI